MNENQPFWYKRFRDAFYVWVFGLLIWTVLIVLPFKPFSNLPPIMIGGGPGLWFVLAYLIFSTIGVGGFGALSSMLHTIETQENRTPSSSTMWPAFLLLGVGFGLSCLLLAIAGAIGGYATTIEGFSEATVRNDLSPFVYPITISSLMTVAGVALALLSMIGARRRSV